MADAMQDVSASGEQYELAAAAVGNRLHAARFARVGAGRWPVGQRG